MRSDRRLAARTDLSRRQLIHGGAALAAAGATAPLTGCASGFLGSSGVLKAATVNFRARNSVNATTGQPVTGLNTILGPFESQHPGRRVEVIDINSSSSNATIAKTQTLLLSGAVDVIQGNTLWPFYEQGLLANLNEYFAQDRWADNFLPAILRPPMERFTYPPWAEEPLVHLSSPGGLDAFSLAFDAQLFEDFRVEPLAAVPDMDDIIEKAEQLTGVNPRTGQECYGLSYDPRAQAHIMLFYLGRGVDLGRVDPDDPSALTLDTPEVRRGIEGMIELAQWCPPGFAIGQGTENWGTEDNSVAVRLVVAPPDMQAAIDNGLSQRYVVTEGVRDRDDHTFLITGPEWAIAADAEDKDAAWELVKYLAGPAGQRLAFANTGALPSWEGADWVDPAQQPYAAPFLASAAAAENAFFPQFMFTTFRPWIAKTVSLALSGQQPDLSAGLADMQRKGEQWVVDSTRGGRPGG